MADSTTADPARAATTAPEIRTKRVNVAVIGAGYSGLSAAIALQRQHPDASLLLLEQSFCLGGTWSINRYPGCACDVWSHLYSFSFAPNTTWSRLYPQRPEILEYLRNVARRFGVEERIRYGCTVRGAAWDDVERAWVVDAVEAVYIEGRWTGRELRVRADFLLSGVGQLNVPRYPTIAGRERFRGTVMHSARWDDTVELRGKRVAVIGNGASAIQIVPELVKEVKHLSLYQRTPNWIVRRDDLPIPKAVRWLLTVMPGWQRALRTLMFWIRESTFHGVTKPDTWWAREFRKQCTGMIQAAFPGRQDLWEKLTPKYDPGCKRICISDDFYSSLSRPNASIETRPIREITEKGIQVVAGDGKEDETEEFDIIVFATGFSTNDFLGRLDITGRGGRKLSDVWKETGGPRAFLGVTVEEMPNFGIFYGPNTNLGHNSIVLMIESQTKYLCGIIREVLEAHKKGPGLVVTPKTDAVETFNQEMQARLAKTSFADDKCGSWYKNEEGKIVNNWVGTVREYQKKLQRIDWSEYDLEGHGVGALSSKQTHVGRVREDLPLGPKTMVSTFVAAVALAGFWLRRSDLISRTSLRRR